VLARLNGKETALTWAPNKLLLLFIIIYFAHKTQVQT